MKFRIVVLLLVVVGGLGAQTSFDYPLRIGNAWQHTVRPVPSIERAVEEHVAANGKTYIAIKKDASNSSRFERVSNDTLFFLDGEIERPLFVFNAPIGALIGVDTTEAYLVETIYKIAEGRQTVFGQEVDIQRFHYEPGLLGQDRTYTVADGIGAIRITNSNSPALDLIGAIIDGDTLGTITSLQMPEQNAGVPGRFQLFQNSPNPFNPTTTIRYSLPKAGNVQLNIYNILGQQVRSAVGGKRSAGDHTFIWDGRNDSGQQAPSGVYVYRLVADGFVESRKLVLMR